MTLPDWWYVGCGRTISQDDLPKIDRPEPPNYTKMYEQTRVKSLAILRLHDQMPIVKIAKLIGQSPSSVARQVKRAKRFNQYYEPTAETAPKLTIFDMHLLKSCQGALAVFADRNNYTAKP
jgi:hypothetical protein